MAVALSDGDVRGMLEFLYEASDVDGPVPFTEPVVEALRRLIRADRGGACNVFAGLDPSARSGPLSVLDFSSVDSEWCFDMAREWTDDFDEACRLFVARDEAIPPHARFMCTPTRQSDVLSSREQRKRELWWYVERHFYADTVWLWLPAPEERLLRRISFASEKRGGIDDRQVRILELLTPHFVQLYRRAAARRGSPAEVHGLTAREHEIMALVRDGKTNKEIAQILWLSPKTVGKHLENVFEKLDVTNRTAAARVFEAR